MSRKKTLYTHKEFCARFRVTGLMLHNAVNSFRVIENDKGKIDITEPVNESYMISCLNTAKQKDNQKKRDKITELDHTELPPGVELPVPDLTAQIDSMISQEASIKLEIKRADLEMKQIAIKKLYSELIGIEVIEGILGKLGSIVRSMVLSIGSRVTEEICAIIGDMSEENKLAVKGIIDVECSRAVKMMIEKISGDITNEME